MHPDKKIVIDTVLLLGEHYGYGMLIAELKRAWAIQIMRGIPGISYEQALEATNTAALPLEKEIKDE